MLYSHISSLRSLGAINVIGTNEVVATWISFVNNLYLRCIYR